MSLISDLWLAYSFGLGAVVLGIEVMRCVRVIWTSRPHKASFRRVALAYGLAAAVLLAPTVTLAILAYRSVVALWA